MSLNTSIISMMYKNFIITDMTYIKVPMPQSLKPIYIPFYVKCQCMWTIKISFTFKKKTFPVYHMYYLLP